MANYNTGYGYTGQNFGTYYPNQPYAQGYQTAVPMPQQSQSQNTLLTVLVGSMDEVLNYPVAAGVTVLLMDFNSGTFWLKSTSKTGVPEPLRAFDFKELIQSQTSQNQNESNFVTKEDFNSLNDRLNALIDKLGGDK